MTSKASKATVIVERAIKDLAKVGLSPSEVGSFLLLYACTFAKDHDLRDEAEQQLRGYLKFQKEIKQGAERLIETLKRVVS